MTAERTHFVYRAFDADGVCLYVGCTGKPGNRYRAHMTGDGDARGWFGPFVAHWTVSGPYPKATALAMEKALIDEIQPIWNGHSQRNLHGRRALIKEYLRFHGVKYEPDPRGRNRPILVSVNPKRRLKQRRVA